MKSKSSHYDTLYQLFSPYFKRILFFLVFGFSSRMLILGSSNVIAAWVDSLTSASNARPFEYYFELIAFCALGGLGLNLFFRIGMARTGARAASKLHDEVMYRVSRMPLSFFDKNALGKILTRFSSDYGAIFRMAGGPFPEFITLLMDILVIFILVMIQSMYLVPCVLGAIAFNLIIYRYSLTPLRNQRQIYSRSRGPTIAHFSESVQGANSIRIFSKTQHFVERLENLATRTQNERVKLVSGVQLLYLKIGAATFSTLGLSILYCLYLKSNGLIQTGDIVVCITTITLLMYTFQNLFEWLTALEEALNGISRMDRYLRSTLEPGALLPKYTRIKVPGQAILANEPAPLIYDKNAALDLPILELKDVCLKYEANGPYRLNHISFDLKKGTKLGIIGKTGSGKSSLLQALLRLYPLSQGSIFFNGREVHTYPLKEYRDSFGYLSQDPALFSGSLLSNLDPQGKKSIDQMEWILKECQLWDWATHLNAKNPLEAVVEEKGANLSQGQKQLVAFARTILKDASVVIYDEATSAIDPDTEKDIQRLNEIYLKEKTVITIAHRLTTLSSADQILWLEQGRVRDFGNPNIILDRFKNSL